MIAISSELINSWIISLLWPLTRILGVMATAPILSDRSIPARVKLGFGIVLTLIIMPTLPPIPQFEIFSMQGLLILVQQLIIGLAMGFSIRLVFAAISQFLTMLLMLIFLSLDGHLMMVMAMADSFVSMPIAMGGDTISPMKIAMWGETIFTTGLLLALPAVTALLITNMALGILTRTAPQLNLFGIGFPVTLSIGFLVLALALQGMLTPMKGIVQDSLSYMQEIVLPVKPSE